MYLQMHFSGLYGNSVQVLLLQQVFDFHKKINEQTKKITDFSS